jgi:hypothetical protein
MKFETRFEYQDEIATVLGYTDDNMPPAYAQWMSSLTVKSLDILLGMLETAAATISEDVVQINGNGPQKMAEIYKVAKENKGKLASTILAIIESNDFEDDPEPFVEETDAGVS